RARVRDRRRSVGGTGAGRGAAQHADRGAASDERSAHRDARMRVAAPDLPHLLRALAPEVLGVVVRRYRDFAAAEDAVQEALVAAATQWPSSGLPDNPRAWLVQVAGRRITDQV